MHGMRGPGSGGVSLREASGQSARTTAIKARTETAVLRHAELQAGSMDDACPITGQLVQTVVRRRG
jgi:hypothetical protein